MTDDQRKANAAVFANAAELIRTASPAALFGDTCNDDAALREGARRFVIATLEAWAVFCARVK